METRVQTPPLLLIQHNVCCLQLGIEQVLRGGRKVGEEEGNEERKIEEVSEGKVSLKLPSWTTARAYRLYEKRACNFHSDCTVGKIF